MDDLEGGREPTAGIELTPVLGLRWHAAGIVHNEALAKSAIEFLGNDEGTSMALGLGVGVVLRARR